MSNPFILPEVVQASENLTRQHYDFERSVRLNDALKRIFSRHLGLMRSGLPFETEGILVTGASGAGKTKEIRHLIDNFNGSQPPLPNGQPAKFVSCMLDAKSGWKGLGSMTSAALGYPLADTHRNTQQQIWRKVLLQAKAQGVIGIHYDEAQHIFRDRSDKEQMATLDSLKTLMKSAEWPLILILSGVPELRGYAIKEQQLFRLLTQVDFPHIHMDTEYAKMHELVSFMAQDAGLDESLALTKGDFYDRLAVAAGSRWGISILITARAIEVGLLESSKTLEPKHFVSAWCNQTGNNPLVSPFMNPHYVAAYPKDRLFWTDRA